MAHSKAQQALAIAIGKRNEAEKRLREYGARVASLRQAEQAARDAEQLAHAAVDLAAQEKVRTGKDDGAAARAAYTEAVVSLSIAEVEAQAGAKVFAQAELELDRLRNASQDLCAAVAVEIDSGLQAKAIEAATALGSIMHHKRALTRYARVAASHSGLREPLLEMVGTHPFKLQIEALLAGKDLEPVQCDEQAMLDAKVAA